MRLVVVDGANVRAATEADADAVDTATLDAGQLNALYERLIGEGNGELVGQFYAEHEHALDAGAEAADEPHVAEAAAASAAATAYVAADGAADDWNYDDDVSGLVTVNRVYAADDAHHATTSATSTTEAWAASIDRDLMGMGIAPDWPVAAVQMWYPRHPHTHFEVGAVINGRFAKFDFTTSGYRLIYNSTPQAVGARFERCHEFALDSVTAASFYHTFLYVVQKNGPYDAGSNDCHTFAVDLCQQFGGTWT